MSGTAEVRVARLRSIRIEMTCSHHIRSARIIQQQGRANADGSKCTSEWKTGIGGKFERKNKSASDILPIVTKLMQSTGAINKPPSYSCRCDALHQLIRRKIESKWNWSWVKAAHTLWRNRFFYIYFLWLSSFVSISISLAISAHRIEWNSIFCFWNGRRYLIFLLEVPAKPSAALSLSPPFPLLFSPRRCRWLVASWRLLPSIFSVQLNSSPKQSWNKVEKIFHFHAPCLFSFRSLFHSRSTSFFFFDWIMDGLIVCERGKHATNKNIDTSSVCELS